MHLERFVLVKRITFCNSIQSKANIELSEEVGRAFVRFIYTGKLDENLLKEHAPSFLELGKKYDLQKLYEAALKMTKTNMSLLRSQVRNLFNLI